MIATLVIFPFLSSWRAGWRIVIFTGGTCCVYKIDADKYALFVGPYLQDRQVLPVHSEAP